MKSFFASIAFLFLIVQAQGQLFGTPTCNYQFTVPDTKGACTTIGSDLDKKVDQVKQDLDKTRLQYVSQNSIVQSTLARVQSDTNGYITKVNNLNNELQKLQQAISSGTGNVQNANQMASNTKDLLTKAVLDINNKIYNLTYQFQKNSVEESKVNSAIQSQINQQAVKMAQTEQQLINLENMLKNLQANAGKPPVSTIGSGISSAEVNKLTQEYQTLQSQVQNADQLQQTQFQSLTNKVNQLFSQTLNQSKTITTVKLGTDSALTRLQTAETDVKNVKDDLDKLQKKIEPEIESIKQDMRAVNNNVTRVESDIKQVGFRLLTGQATSMKDHKTIANMQKTAQNLQTEVNRLSNQTTSQAGELVRLTGELNKLLNVPGSGGNASAVSVSNALQNFQQKTQQELLSTNHTLASLQKQVVTLLTQITPLLTHSSTG